MMEKCSFGWNIKAVHLKDHVIQRFWSSLLSNWKKSRKIWWKSLSLYTLKTGPNESSQSKLYRTVLNWTFLIWICVKVVQCTHTSHEFNELYSVKISFQEFHEAVLIKVFYRNFSETLSKKSSSYKLCNPLSINVLSGSHKKPAKRSYLSKVSQIF